MHHSKVAARFLAGRSCSAGLSQRSGRGLYSRLDSAAGAFATAQAVGQPAQQGECLTYRVSLEDIQASQKGKLRLDAFLSARTPRCSRARVQDSIRRGHVAVNGAVTTKTAAGVQPGDAIDLVVYEPAPIAAVPEDIPLDVVFEDTHVLVVNKAAGMVVHPSPGHPTGTLVNAVLHHCNLPAMRVLPGQQAPASLDADWGADAGVQPQHLPAEDEDDDDDDGDEVSFPAFAGLESDALSCLRPGIVHRLDKGTTGLLVVAKDAESLWKLGDQFKAHTVDRRYMSLTLGCPKVSGGRVEANVGRDLRDRKRMAAFTAHSTLGRHAASNYEVVEELAGGAAAAVRWRLETGRTHQIRVHAKHLSHPLLGDETYGSAGTAVTVIGRTNGPRRAIVKQLLADLARPALHAQTLGFTHPITGERMHFDSALPPDFVTALDRLRAL